MTTIRQLYSLQELDLALGRVEGQKADVERELGVGITLDGVEAVLQAERDKLQELKKSYPIERLEAESRRARAEEQESKLYSGATTSARELGNMEKEVVGLREQVRQLDAALLELSLKMEESQGRCNTLEQQILDARAAWERRQAELREQIEGLDAERRQILTQRTQLAATVESAELTRYDSLRKSKGGRAVAKVERGLCQACRMSLPTQQLQRLRSGRQTVLCSSCGRMLFVS